jgi:hypothetical protein
MFDVLCQDCSDAAWSGAAIAPPAHLLTLNDNTSADRANHRKKQRFETMRGHALRIRRLCAQTEKTPPETQYVASFELTS